MRTFTLRFDDDGRGQPKVVEFDGETPQSVFSILEGEQFGRLVEMWEGPVKLGTLLRGRNKVWSVR